MSVPYEKIVEEDLNLGVGEVQVTMPGGGTATGNKIGPHTFYSRVFGASLGSPQALAGSTVTVQLDTEDLDTDSWYDPATYEFQPDQAGIYLITGEISVEAFSGIATLYIYRGASPVAKQDAQRTAGVANIQVSALLSMNGSTDVITLRVGHTDGSSRNAVSASLSGVLLGRS